MMRWPGLALALILGLLAAPAVAQSVYGCTDLASRIAIPSVEGANGVFYRIDPDLQMFHAFADETVADLAELSQVLAASGTTLIYLPVPTKALAMPDQLPQAARDLGFDLPIATTVYDDILRRLADAGVLSANLRSALRTAPEAPQSFFATDERLTSAGARRAAAALAEVISATPGFVDLPKSRFETQATGTAELPSDTHAILQRHCSIDLPPVLADTFATTRFQSGTETTDTAIFGGGSSGQIAIVGTDYTGGAAANLAGFLAEATGLEVIEYTVPQGGSFAAISTYLTSRGFAENRPAYLVWANPVFNSLAQHGDAPLRELVAAAGDTCRVALPLAAGVQANAVSADLTGLQAGQDYTLFVDADGAPAQSARFSFVTSAGQTLIRDALRHPGQVATGRFYLSMAGLGPDLQSVRIDLDVPMGLNARVTACFD